MGRHEGDGARSPYGLLVLFGIAVIPVIVLTESLVPALAGLVGRRPEPVFAIGAAIGLSPLVPFAVARWRRGPGAASGGRWVWASALLLLVALATAGGRGGESERLRRDAPYAGAGAVAGLVTGLGALLRFGRGEPPRPDGVRRPPRRPRPGHETVSILYVRPGPDEPDPWLPYYCATCACGWVGAQVPDEEAARTDAWLHSPGAEPVVTRPAG